MSDDSRLTALITRLDELTRTGRVRWELAEAGRDDVFTYATPAGAVAMSSRDCDGRDPYIVAVRDSEGRLVERVEVGKDHEELYRLARRQALRTDAVIEALLDDLR